MVPKYKVGDRVETTEMIYTDLDPNWLPGVIIDIQGGFDGILVKLDKDGSIRKCYGNTIRYPK